MGALAGILFSIGYLAFKRLSPRILIPSISVFIVICIIFFRAFDFGSFASMYDRVYYWRVSLALWLENPIIGVSVSNFRDAYHQVALTGSIEPFIAPDGSIYQLDYIQHSHNIFIMLLASTGILGLGTFLWLFVNAIRLIIKNHEGLRVGLLTWPVVLFVIGLTGWNIYNSWYQSLFAFFMVLIGSANPQTSQKND
jgi:O-antigen ligase